eukprot:1896225-Amphidinium_carterae.1
MLSELKLVLDSSYYLSVTVPECLHVTCNFSSLQQWSQDTPCSSQVKGEVGVFGQSYDMWMQIDPHLLLFTLLPALLAGDAMTIDTSVA